MALCEILKYKIDPKTKAQKSVEFNIQHAHFFLFFFGQSTTLLKGLRPVENWNQSIFWIESFDSVSLPSLVLAISISMHYTTWLMVGFADEVSDTQVIARSTLN